MNRVAVHPVFAVFAVFAVRALGACSPSAAPESEPDAVVLAPTEPVPVETGPGTAYLDAPYAKLSEYHLDGEGVLVPYEVQNELFSDYSDKSRGLHLPAGTTATWAGEKRPIELPVGAILAKRFSYGPRWIETRLLVHARDGWRGHAYVKDDGADDATLRPGGAIVEVELTRPDGRAARAVHLVPSEQQCKKCHADDDALVPIGLRPVSFDRGDQIARFAARGLLTGAPRPATQPRAPRWDDPTSGTLADRARAYLDANCASCHHETGSARTSGLYLRHDEEDPNALGLCKPPVAAGRGSGDLRFGIVPGRPDESIVIHRMRSTEPAVMMPEIGRSLAHEEAIAVVAGWIAALPGACP